MGERRRGDELTPSFCCVRSVIDMGIDWTHPVFGGYESAPNEKVVHAASLTGEHPLDNFGHGTHVAAIIAADAEYKGTPRGDAQVSGVAPKAKLMGYKVLTAAGSGSATNIILAMEDAARRGAHVMNLSLGDSFGDPYSPESSAANNAMLAGCIMVIAAGNAGPERSSVGAPGAAHHVITVGASTDEGVTALVAELNKAGADPQQLEMRLMEGSVALPTPAIDLAYVPCGLGAKAKDFPKEVKGKIALIQRGEVTFRDKAINAQNAGALACVIYNNRDGNFFGSMGEEADRPKIPAISISKADGELMIQARAEADGGATLRLTPTEVPQPDRLAEFSSRGPNNDGYIKPEITAPGVNIYAATITQAAMPGGGMPDPSGYISASGTSMATPHVAGMAALLRQAHPDWTSTQIKAALVNTARWMKNQGTVMDQGNGAADLARAMDCRAILVTATDPVAPTHSFGQMVHAGKVVTASQSLTIRPLDAEAAKFTYELSVELVGAPEGLTAELSAGSVSCSLEGCNASFDLKLTADGVKVQDAACYGFVVAQSEWGQLRLPFYCETAKAPRQTPPDSGANNPIPGIPPQRRPGGMPCC